VYGNTERIAKTIADGIGPAEEVQLMQVKEASRTALQSVDLFIVGSPTQGGRPTPAIQAFLSAIPSHVLDNVAVAAFDTRVSAEGKGIALRILLGMVGYAAGRIASTLQRKGGALAIPSAGFMVEGKEGPLKQGELERAAAWAQGIRRTNPQIQYTVG
jgi:flavodoxin